MAWLISNALMAVCENSHCLPAQAAESSEGTCLDGAPSAPSSGTPTPQAYLWPDRTTAAWRRFPSGTTCKPLTDAHGEAVLTWCLADSHARTSAQQAKVPASTGPSQACGHTWRELSVRFDPDTFSWKTHRCLFTEDLPESSVILPRWGMLRGGVCWERAPSERPTSGTDSGSWLPTPTAKANMMAPSMQKWPAHRRLWPTPSASDNRDRGHMGMPAIVRRVEKGKQIMLSMAVSDNRDGGSLNPTWVEWLMGWPTGWTDCGQSATGRFQEWLHLHGRR